MIRFAHTIIYIFSYDIWFYFSHVLLHTRMLYKMIHYKHHSINHKTMTMGDAYEGHLLESPFQGAGVFIPLFFLSFDIYTLFASLILINIRGMLRHDTRFIWLIGNHHILHHRYPQSNFGEYWLDNLLGTAHLDKNDYVYGAIYI